LRFKQEAKSAAKLSHANIVQIYDTVSNVDESGHRIEAIVMEYVEGRTLRGLLDDHTYLRPSDVIDVGQQVCSALEMAHRNGVVHRDIKPSNILVRSDRRVMVTDFGIAKAGEDTDLTVTGTLLGTAKYLAPEQVNGDEADPRSDLYSLGVVLFEALTGKPPFSADTDVATAFARLQGPAPRASQFRSDIGRTIDDIVDRLLQREPDDRFSTAADVRAALGYESQSWDQSSAHLDETKMITEMSAPSDDIVIVAEEPEPEIGFIRSERSWIVPALVLVLIASALVLAGVLLSRSPIADVAPDFELPATSSDPTTTALLDTNEIFPPVILSASTMDRQGDGSERDELVGSAFDGDLNTAWKTETYRRPAFGDLKTGVGLLIDLGRRSEINSVSIASITTGWRASIYVGDDFSGDISTWGEASGEVLNGDGNAQISIDGAIGTKVLLWITEPGVSPDGSDENETPDNRFELGEISLS
jgi:serine/threonine protein kinase